MINSLKKHIKAYILDTGLSIRDLERKAGLKPRTLYNYLYDRSKSPKIDTLIAISKVIGCSIDELINEESPKSTINEFKEEILKKESASLPWNVHLAIECLKEVSEYCILKKYSLDAEKAFTLCRKIYEYCLQNKNQKLDSVFSKWLIDEMMRE